MFSEFIPCRLFTGIRNFRRQCTKEDKLKEGFSFGDDSILAEEEEEEDVHRVRDDLESTKQLLELEVRSKKLLEKDNKRLQGRLSELFPCYICQMFEHLQDPMPTVSSCENWSYKWNDIVISGEFYL